jgi:hypothetical protein
MKSVMQRISAVKEDQGEGTSLFAMIGVILLVLTFTGASLYVLVNSAA